MFIFTNVVFETVCYTYPYGKLVCFESALYALCYRPCWAHYKETLLKLKAYQSSTQTTLYGTVRTVVWEDGRPTNERPSTRS
jgi:hypothetical protein